ncbi:MAG: SPOR domain-containing protein [Arcticibacter sp.]
MNISLYISELLRDYDEVCLSDIGTFYKERTPASFNEASGVFKAPYDQVRFRSAADGDDVLVRYISQAKKISEASSRYFINKFVNSIQQSLASDNQVELQPIGILKNGHSGLQLIAADSSPAYFGLPAVQDPAYSSRVRTLNTAQVEQANQLEVMEEESESSGTGKTLTIAFIILLIAAGLLYVFQPSLFNLTADKPITERNKPKVETPAASKAAPVAAPAETIKDSSTSGTAVNHQDSVKTQVRTPATTPVTTPAKTPVKATAPAAVAAAPSFEVIGASFALSSEAETYVKLMQSRGIKARVVEDTRKPKYKISLGSFSTFEAANVEKRRVQSTFNKEAWILTVNDKAKK